MVGEAGAGVGSSPERRIAGQHYFLNPYGEDYNTPTSGVDHRDGAGVPHADTLSWFCGEGSGDGSESDGGEGDFDFGASGPIPEGHEEAPSGTPPGDDGEPTTLGLPSGTPRIGQTVFGWEGMEPGRRIRATITWDSCPLGSLGSAPAAVATDFDLLLYNVERAEYLYVSQSYDDNVEGFDVIIPDGWEGTFELWIVHPETHDAGCDGDGDGAGDGEPWAWTVTWW